MEGEIYGDLTFDGPAQILQGQGVYLRYNTSNQPLQPSTRVNMGILGDTLEFTNVRFNGTVFAFDATPSVTTQAQLVRWQTVID